MKKLSDAVRTMILAEDLGCWGIHLEGRLIELSKRPSLDRLHSAQMALASAAKLLESLAARLGNEAENDRDAMAEGRPKSASVTSST